MEDFHLRVIKHIFAEMITTGRLGDQSTVDDSPTGMGLAAMINALNIAVDYQQGDSQLMITRFKTHHTCVLNDEITVFVPSVPIDETLENNTYLAKLVIQSVGLYESYRLRGADTSYMRDGIDNSIHELMQGVQNSFVINACEIVRKTKNDSMDHFVIVLEGECIYDTQYSI
jgi:hypothetical protein